MRLDYYVQRLNDTLINKSGERQAGCHLWEPRLFNWDRKHVRINTEDTGPKKKLLGNIFFIRAAMRRKIQDHGAYVVLLARFTWVLPEECC